MAALNFPNPDATQTYTEAGITWTWNATLGVWSSDDNDGFTETDADQRYMRVDAGAGAQTRVSGEATFAELTTHEAGVSVTGGSVESTVTYANSYTGDVPNHLHIANPTINNTIDGGSLKNFSSTIGDATGTALADINHFFVNVNGAKNLTTVPTNQYGYFARGLDQATNNYGFYSDLGASTKGFNTYNFYAAGDAPNYFAGSIASDGAIQGNGVSSRGNVTGANWGGNQFAGFYCRHSSVTGVIGSQGFTADSIAAGSNGEAIHFFSRGTASDNNFNYAFRTSLNTSTGSGANYAFYAEGTASSYFGGGMQFELAHSQGGTQDQLLLNNYEEGTFTVACDNAATDSLTKDDLSFYRSEHSKYTRTG